MDTILLAADTVYGLIFLAAGVLAALQTQRDLRIARTLILVGAAIMTIRWIVWAGTTDAPWWVRGIVGALIGAAIFILIPSAVAWVSSRIESNNETRQEESTREKAAIFVQNLAGLSNEELREKTQSLAGRMRAFQSGVSAQYQALYNKYPPDPGRVIRSPEQQQAMTPEFMALSNKVKTEWNRSMRPEGLALREEMSRRLGMFPPFPHHPGTMALEDNQLAGPSPISNAADFLESLARALPN